MRKKGTKLLSLILAVMMVVGAIPITASAVTPAGKIGITLKAGSVDPSAVNKSGKITDLNVRKFANNYVTKSATTGAEAKTISDKLNTLFTTPEEKVENADIEVNGGETFWLAVDMDDANLSSMTLQDASGASVTGKGLIRAFMYFGYDDSVFTPNADNAYTNPVLRGDLMEDPVENFDDADEMMKYYAQISNSASIVTDTLAGSSLTHFLYPNLEIQSNTKYYLPVGVTDWEMLIPITVNSAATPGVYEISFIPDSLGSGAKGAVNASTPENGTTGTLPTVDVDGKTKIHCETLRVKVAGPGVDISASQGQVLNAKDQQIKVDISSAAYSADASTPANWSVQKADGSDPITPTSVSVSGTTATLTVDFTGKTAKDEYVVVCKAAANNAGKDLTTAKKVALAAAMVGTASITPNTGVVWGDTLTANLSTGNGEPTTGLTYKWYRAGVAISGQTGKTYVTTEADVDKAITVTIGASSYVGETKPSTAVTVGKKAGPTLVASTGTVKQTYGAPVSADVILAALKVSNSSITAKASDLTIGTVSGGLTKAGNGTITVNSGTTNGTVNVKIKETATVEASNEVAVTIPVAKKQLTLATSGEIGSGVEATLPTFNKAEIVNNDAPTITWTQNTAVDCSTSGVAGGKITPTLEEGKNSGSVTLTPSISSDDYKLADNITYTLTVSAKPQTSITLNKDAADKGFTVTPTSIEQGKSGDVTIYIPTNCAIDSVKVNGADVTLTTVDSNHSKFTLNTTVGQSTAAVVITFHASIQVTATITSKPYDGTKAIDKSDVSFSEPGVDFEKAEYEDANVGTNKVVTITGITWPDTVNEYKLAAVTGDITAVTPASADAAATAVANTNPTTANVIEAIKAAVITFTNADGKKFTMTVGDLLADATTDTVLEAAINDAIDGVEAFESTAAPVDNVKYDASQATVSATVNPGSVIAAENAGTDKTFTLVNVFNDEATPVEITSGFSVDPATGEITVDTTVVPDVYTLNITTAAKTLSDMKEEAAATITATITVEECAKEYKLENLAENATGEIDLGNIVSKLDAAKSPNIAALPATIELSLNVTKSTTPPPGPSGSFKPYMDGYEDGTLLPGRSVTRAQFAKMLVIATGKFDETKTYEKPDYPDVIEGKWYVPYIACAVENKIMDGKEDGKMYPNKTITRQEAAKMIYVALGTTDEIKTTDKVKDFDSVQNWAKMYVATLVEKNIIKGFDDGTFKPKNNITRAQAAVMINRLLGFDPDEAERAKIAELTIEDQFPDVKPSGNWSYAHLMYAAGKLPDSYYAG